jgi:nicotinate-nucleotide adenylyltransferase
MKRIGILGGSYNPIHVGHIQLAEHLLRVLSFDEVWLLVSPHNPLKPANDLLPDAIRYQWVAKSIEGVSGLVASDFELALPQPSYTYNTLTQLTATYPQNEFTLLIGADNWQVFHKWFRVEDIINNFQIAIYPRPGSDTIATPLSPNVQVIDAPLIDISSTMIRQKIRNHEDISHLVPKVVQQEVIKAYLNRP